MKYNRIIPPYRIPVNPTAKPDKFPGFDLIQPARKSHGILSSTPAPPFTPGDISNRVLWYSASYGVTQSSNNVSQVDDPWNALHATPYDSNQPVYSASGGPNSKPMITLGSNRILLSPASNLIKTPVFTILLVLEITQALGSFRSVFSTAGTAAWDTGYGASNPITAGILRMFGSYASTYVEISPTLSTWYALMMTYDGANLRVYLNNSEQGSIAVGSPTYATTTKLAIGGAFNTGSSYGYSCGMSFTDMLVYDKCVDTTERNDLHSWVNTNYGI